MPATPPNDVRPAPAAFPQSASRHHGWFAIEPVDDRRCHLTVARAMSTLMSRLTPGPRTGHVATHARPMSRVLWTRRAARTFKVMEEQCQGNRAQAARRRAAFPAVRMCNITSAEGRCAASCRVGRGVWDALLER